MSRWKEIRELVKGFCSVPGTPGGEQDAAAFAVEQMKGYGCASIDRMGNVVLEIGNQGSDRRILLDAHIDQVGLIVTSINEKGFLKIAPCGGADRRTLPGQPVQVLGKETVTGVVCCLPPHLVDGGEDKVPSVDEMAVDIGLTKEEAEAVVEPGDRIVFLTEPQDLLGSRITAPALDDRAGCAVLLRAVQMLASYDLKNCAVSVLLSTREETGEQGAKTAAFWLDPTEAIVVDVSFAEQPGVSSEKSGKLGAGPMLGIAPGLDRKMGAEIAEIAKQEEIPFQYEVMGGPAGTNADQIGVSRGGVRCAMLSIPLRNMHTPTEIVDLQDLEHTAQLIAAYIGRVG